MEGCRGEELLCGKCSNQRLRPFALWVRWVTCNLIWREFDTRVPIREIGEWVARCGCQRHHVAPRMYERGDAAVKDWL